MAGDKGDVKFIEQGGDTTEDEGRKVIWRDGKNWMDAFPFYLIGLSLLASQSNQKVATLQKCESCTGLC